MEFNRSTTDLRVLVIEDNPDHLRLVQHCVTKLDPDWEIVAVGSMAESLVRLDQPDAHFALILLDLNLPDSRGMRNLDLIRESAGDTPVIVLTGDDDTAFAAEAVHRGAEDFIVKQEMSGRCLIRAMRYAVERHELRRELVRASLTDELTGLLNRRAFLAMSRQQVALAKRNHQPLLLMFADLDGLKVINDTLGHEAGDRAIGGVAAILQAVFRDSDVVARLGGDEFAVLMPETSPDRVARVVERLHEKLEVCGLSLSTGVGRFTPGEEISLEDLMARADASLYEMKRGKTSRTPVLF